MITDLSSERQIIEHFRDLILLSNLFDYDAEMVKFIQKLKEHGWSQEEIDKVIEKAGYGTFWEERIDPVLPSLGDQREYQRNRARWKK